MADLIILILTDGPHASKGCVLSWFSTFCERCRPRSSAHYSPDTDELIVPLPLCNPARSVTFQEKTETISD